MGLTTAKEEQLKKQPIIENRVFRSADGRFIVQRTTITHIRPVEYYAAMLTSDSGYEDDEE